ncbi:GNAT family N-acetyltransferase [Goodfellowiella coeruleoviolacea]|uniref:Protein N-acetyltransferase, RimJ/RimL family n=1 Tax=Goodfellowiella coeruleoviolacea TaxID=334858 RepID=A0AAE3GA03_9PSEU|nr:GNAT family N-acetyltransferase [Goodfellowiella coeruleoviolacea]MCP2164416.1 Protein N-acetyltransferase, RimJ/RimL family [Goodfellowiella coeruleoviolacea]
MRTPPTPVDPWPLRHLVLRTPRLELRPDDDAGLLQLAEQARQGIHDPEWMPFGVAWTDAPAEELGTDVLRFHWGQRAALSPARWTVNFLVRLNGEVIGNQGLTGHDFAVTREVRTGSWLGRRHQGHGYGTEMRAAVLMLAFDHLGARTARSSARLDNAPSLGVSRRLGYVEDGTEVVAVRDEPSPHVRLLLTAERFAEHRPSWWVDVRGLDACLPLLISGDGTA